MIDNLIILLFVFFSYRLVKNIGKSFPLFELITVLYLLQYCIAPMYVYNYSNENLMPMNKDEYLNYAIISCAFFIIGLFSVKNQFKLTKVTISSRIASKLGRALLFIGVLASVLILFLPVSLGSIANFFILFKTIGLYSLIFSKRKSDKIIVIIFFLEIALSSILNALLIEFIIFSIFFSIFFALRYKITNKVKYFIIFSNFIFLIVYQSVKQEYRMYTWESNTNIGFTSKLNLLSNLLDKDSFNSIFSTDFLKNESIYITMSRLNQGWHTSMVLNHVPTVVDYKYGSDFLNDIISAILPRFVWPDKRIVNDYKRFNHFTGYSLIEGTAMSFGILGDFYLNFGFLGSFIALFIFGHIISRLLLRFYKHYVFKNHLNLIWLPYFFSYLIRPGNEFYMVLNHLIKAYILFYIINKFYLAYLIQKTPYESNEKS